MMQWSRIAIGLILYGVVAQAAERVWLQCDQLPRTHQFAGTAATRARLLHNGFDLADSRNYCVDRDWLIQLQETGVQIHHVSRWLDRVSISGSKEAIDRAVRFSGARSISRVHTQHMTLPVIDSRPLPAVQDEDPFYGGSWTQLAQLGIPHLHDLGYTGTSVFVGMLDTGWQLNRGPLSHVNIVATWDFYHNDPNVENEDGDDPNQDDHGTCTLSCIAAYSPGNLIGGAWNAQYALAKTEHVDHELNREEDDWVAGIEWLDSLGVDLVSSSLGYTLFDPGQEQYSYDDLNGDLAVTTIAADLAVERGIVVITSAGNSGDGNTSWGPWISTPADGDSVLAIGAVAADSIIASFSSRGPTPDGRIKPDFVAMGAETRVLNPYQSGPLFVPGWGTSFAAPVFAGGVALILEIAPYLTPDDLRQRLRRYGDRADDPDSSTYGYGLVDLHALADELMTEQFAETLEVNIWPNPFTDCLWFLIRGDGPDPENLTIRIYDILGRLRYQQQSPPVAAVVDEGVIFQITPPADLATGMYFAQLSCSGSQDEFQKTEKIIKVFP